MEGLHMYLGNKLNEVRFGKEPKPKVLMFSELKTWPFWRAVLAEFVGTMIFVFIGCMSAIPLDGPQSTIKIAFCFGLAIMALIQMFGHVSGGHFNPAVSIGLAVSLVITPVRAVFYTIAQTLGGLIGGFILKGVSPTAVHSNLGLTTLNSTLNPGQGVGVEIILTFVLVYVIIATTDSNRTDYGSVSMKIGLTVGLLHLSGIVYTGSSMNPARSFGSAVASGYYVYHWIYWVGPIIGGIIASILYTHLFSPYKHAMPVDVAIEKLLTDGSMIAVPRDYANTAGTSVKNGTTPDNKIDTMHL